MSDKTTLDVYIADHLYSEHLVARLSKQGRNYGLQYATSAQTDISLTMPRRSQIYTFPELHPVFQMHLPEGPVRQMLEYVISKAEGSGDLSLLLTLSDNQHGRLRFALPGTKPNAPFKPNKEDNLHNVADTDGLFTQMMTRYAKNSAQASVQPRINTSVQGKAALPTPYYIIKSWGSEYPELACNEYTCMKFARTAGLNIPQTQLGDRNRTILSHRIDKNKQGLSTGFEDFAVLQAKSTTQRYDSSLEACAKTIRQFISPRYQADALRQFFMLTLLNVIVRNGDAHLKNLAVSYEHSGDRKLAPFFDITTTTIYLPNDFMALSLNDSKQWPNKKSLINFGVQHCILKPQQVQTCFTHIEKALTKSHSTFYQLCKTRTEFQNVAEAMEKVWAEAWKELQ